MRLKLKKEESLQGFYIFRIEKVISKILETISKSMHYTIFHFILSIKK